MNANTETIYKRLVKILSNAQGKERAIKIDSLAMRLGLTKLHPVTRVPVPDRRPVEQTLTEYWDRFPFLLVSGSAGVWIATCADDLNSFIHNIRTRHTALRHKDDVTCRKARAFGYAWQDDRFVDPPVNVQQELFS